MNDTHKTHNRFARLICYECDIGEERGPLDNGERFLTMTQYEQQMMDPDRGWRCPACGCYPCDFDDEYFELPVQ